MWLRTVLFDLDGTLVDSAPAIAAALSDIRRERGLSPLGADRVRPWISLGASELVRRGLEDGAIKGAGDLAAFRTALARRPAPEDSVYGGVAPLLDALTAAGLRLAVVTNKPEGLAQRLLEQLGLRDRFGALVGGDTAGTCKPDPAPSLLALHRLGCAAEEAAFVGDSRIDGLAAAALQIPFHLFTAGYGAEECDGLPMASRFDRHLDLVETLLGATAHAVPGAA